MGFLGGKRFLAGRNRPVWRLLNNVILILPKGKDFTLGRKDEYVDKQSPVCNGKDCAICLRLKLP
jgi:hypothetical protein